MIGTQAAGAAQSAFGSMFQAKAQKANLESQARLADINAGVIENDARRVTGAGVIEESRIRLAGAQAKSSQMAQLASSGVDIAGSPSAQARLNGTDYITEVDANTVRANALRAAWGQRFEAVNMRNTARSARASAASISPGMAFASSLISGAGQVASSWYAMGKEGGLGGGSPRLGAVDTTNWTQDRTGLPPASGRAFDWGGLVVPARGFGRGF